jgi:hypothetical protein
MMVGDDKKSDLNTYESQVQKFPTLKEVMQETIKHIKQEQDHLVHQAEQLGIRTDTVAINQDLDGEFSASVVEVILEGLRWIEPPLLDKKENNIYGLV